MSKTINLNLDTAKSDIQNPKILLRQGDGNYQTLRVTITSNGEPTDLTNADVIYLGTTSADHKIIDSNITKVDALNGVIDYRPPKQWGQDMGNFKNSYFEITTGDSTGSTASFKVSVLEAVDLNAEQAGDYITVVDGIVATVRKELSDQLADVKVKTDNATGLVKQASDNLVAMAQNYNTDITNKYNDAKNKANDINQMLNTGAFAKVGASNTFTANQTISKDLTVSGALHANADNAVHADKSSYADKAGTSGWANGAGQADNATHASNADNATHAVNADVANSAKSANVANSLNPANSQTVNDLTVNGRIYGNAVVKNIKIGKLNAVISRFGPQVFLSIPTQDWPYDSGSPWTIAYDMVVPIGYRPVSKANLPMMNRFATSFMQVNTDGTMYFSSESVDNSTGFETMGSWSTNDSWPE